MEQDMFYTIPYIGFIQYMPFYANDNFVSTGKSLFSLPACNHKYVANACRITLETEAEDKPNQH